MRAIGRIFVFAGAVLMATTATAGPLVLTNVGGPGGWQNPVPPETPPDLAIANAGGSLTDSISWGTNGIGQSGYDFNPVDGAINPVLGTPFLLGVFTHRNVEIDPPFLETVEYSLSFDTNGVPSPLSHTFSFSHDETPNSAPCAAGPEGPSVSVCDDFVAISNLVFNSLITVGPDVYFFNLLGFSKDGGSTFTGNQFQSPEFQSNAAGLYARVTEQPVIDPRTVVPEPSTFLLLGSGVLAVVGRQIARRRAR